MSGPPTVEPGSRVSIALSAPDGLLGQLEVAVLDRDLGTVQPFSSEPVVDYAFGFYLVELTAPEIDGTYFVPARYDDDGFVYAMEPEVLVVETRGDRLISSTAAVVISAEQRGSTHSLKRGDTQPLTAQLVDEAGPLNLTEATVKFAMRRQGSREVITVDASVTGATSGEVSVPWSDQDVERAGKYDAEFEITFATGKRLTVPPDRFREIQIVEDLA